MRTNMAISEHTLRARARVAAAATKLSDARTAFRRCMQILEEAQDEYLEARFSMMTENAARQLNHR